ncbi:MAG TPA: carbohydrate-binding protein, partial [Candidatus Dormibacteraeota bacterium]|nr:carbohydrate-binding protein [Candidatus Dormibacteraeota bacterium]
LYSGQPATHDIDYHLAGSNPDSPLYRVLDPPNGIVQLDDSYRTGAGPRPGFIDSDYKVGWTDPGDWFNYTRNYGAGGFYNIYLRSSHGDPAATIGGGVDLVEGATTAQQTTTRLGSFRAPATGNWDGFIFIPLKNANGAQVVSALSGVQTLRYTVEANGGDINYMMLVPVCASSIAIGGGPPTVTVRYSGGTLQSAPAITGPWGNVAGAANGVFTGPLSGAQQYFRVLCQ